MKPVSDINTPDMSAFWMPFTANQQFKAAPRILKRGAGSERKSSAIGLLAGSRHAPGPPTMAQRSSNRIEAPSQAVAPVGSKGGETSTRSAPAMSRPARWRTTSSA